MWAGPAGAPAAAMVDRSRTISRSLSPMPQSQFSIWSCLINKPRCPCERIADHFNDNLAVEWTGATPQTWKSTLRYSCCYLRVQVPLEQYYSRSRHVTYICPKRFRFFGVLSKNTVHPQASNTIREVLEPLWLWPWEIWELTSDGSWQLACCFGSKLGILFWATVLQYCRNSGLHMFDQNMVLASVLLHKLPVTSWQTRLRTNGCSISLHDTSERGCSSNFFRVHHHQAFWLNYARIIAKKYLKTIIRKFIQDTFKIVLTISKIQAKVAWISWEIAASRDHVAFGFQILGQDAGEPGVSTNGGWSWRW